MSHCDVTTVTLLFLSALFTSAQSLGLDTFQETLFSDFGLSAGVPGHYFLSHPLTNGHDAKFACAKLSRNGYLAEFNSEGEKAFVLERIGSQMHTYERVLTGNYLLPDSHTLIGNKDSGESPCTSIVKRHDQTIALEVSSCATDRARFLCEVEDVE